ncbi:MAG: hypothetical protein FWC27_03360 [Firmicutes bacterium]|nr:hypothetical protein [Bacillota bacterium]
MNFDINAILGTANGFLASTLGAIYKAIGLSNETGSGLLNFVSFFAMLEDIFVKLIARFF